MQNGIDWGNPQKAIEVLGKHIAMWRWEVPGGRIQWSDHLLEILGMAREDFAGTFDAYSGLIHPDDVAASDRLIAEFLETGEVYNFRVRMRHADGHYVPVLSQGTLIRNEDGTVAEMLGTITDLSDEMDAYQRLVEREKTFKSLTDNVPSAIFQYIVGPDGVDVIKYMSSGCEDIWELSAAEIEEVPTRIWDLVHEDDVAAMQESVLLSAETMGYWSHEWRILTPSGKVRHLEGRGLPKQLEDGSIVWDCVIFDVSGQKALRDELVKQEEMLGQVQKIDAIGRVSGGIAHDFNNLLAVVLGNAELVRDTVQSPEAMDSLDAIIGACGRGSELTRRLLTFARKARLEPERLDANEVVAHASTLLARLLPESITIKTLPCRDLWECNVDRSFLENSLVNLCINARDAMTDGMREGGILSIETRNLNLAEGDPETRLSGVSAGRYIEISVTDTGAGIPEDNIDKVTEPFFTTKAPDQGTGLGLAMVHGFIRQSAGGLFINSEVGVGTRIRLLLPSNGKAALLIPNTPDERVSTAVTGTGTILVVEDEPGILSMLRKMLTTAGFEAFFCTDADTAFATFGENGDHIDVLLSDMVMPGKLQGVSLAAKMVERYPKLRVVFMSGYANEENRTSEGLANVDRYLMKPVNRAELIDVLNQSVRRARG